MPTQVWTAMATTGHIPLSDDAALVATLAGTALPFSHCAEDEAERWLRALRLHGQVGAALQGLGVGEAPLEGGADHEHATPPLGQDALERAVRAAERHATERGTGTAATADLLCGVLEVYGDLFDGALARRGATRTEVLARLGELDQHPERT